MRSTARRAAPVAGASGHPRRPGARSVLARTVTALALTLAAVCGGLTVGAAPAMATAQPMSACTTTKGVVLAVDFSHWGGPLLRSCGTTPTTGYTLLNQGGWATTGTQHDGPAFICRIGYAGYQGGKQYPTSKDAPCVLTPPATAYWSYWHADAGQNTWSYSQLGAMSYHPKPGSVDLWIFGATNVAGTQGRPTFSPDSVRAHNTTSGGATSAPPRPTKPAGTHTTAGSVPGKTSRPAATTPSATRTTPATTSARPTATPTGTASASTAPGTGTATGGTPSPGQPRTQDAEPTAAASHSSGSVLPFALTAAVVAVIAGFIVVRTRRRRNAE
ncbi:hypothetical protein [Streptomyces sp. NPDC008317]|uniref:hypothetical protein n=1 Tax=Streptomyces sp. NPDC008317 TaxID=3364827 RepID=UPI0036EAF512